MPRMKMRTADGVALAGRIRSVDDPRATIVVVHGFTARQDHPEVLAVADALVAHRFDVVTYDARGHGDSEGTCTLGHRERADVAAAVAVARERSPHVVVVGASMGAIATLRYATHDPDLAGVVTVSAPANWRLPRSLKGLLVVLATRTPPGRSLVAKRMKVRLSRSWEGGEPPKAMAARLDVPLAVIHGRADGYVAHTEATDLYEAARGPRRLEVIDGMGHAYDVLAIPAIVDAAEWALSLSVTR